VFERKDGRWQADIMINGKRKSFYGATRREANQKAKKAQHDVEDGSYVEPSRQKLGEYLDYWLAAHKLTIKTSTGFLYSKYVERYLVPIKHILLQKLTTEHIQRLYDTLLNQNYAASTICLIHTILKSALNDAIKWEKLAKNPCKNVKLPRIEKREIVVLSIDETQQLISAAQDALENGQQIGTIVLLLLTTGLRIGEALALRWQNIDFVKKELSVEKTLSYNLETHTFYLATPKTESSRRNILMPDLTIEILQKHKAWERDTNLVFTKQSGGFVWCDTVRCQFRRLLKSAGLSEEMHLHDLRHNMATFLIAAKIPMKTVQDILGHSSMKITADIYAHVTPNMRLDASNEIDRILGKKS
jgi:integrase